MIYLINEILGNFSLIIVAHESFLIYDQKKGGNVEGKEKLDS